jgi:hypothetical protein
MQRGRFHRVSDSPTITLAVIDKRSGAHHEADIGLLPAVRDQSRTIGVQSEARRKSCLFTPRRRHIGTHPEVPARRRRRRRRRGPSGPSFILGQRRLACQRALLAVPIAGGRSGQPAHDAGADQTMVPAAISLAPTAPALPRGKPQGVRSPSMRPPEPGASAAVLGSWAFVALAPQWRQNYPNNRPPTRANAISEMGQVRTLAAHRTPSPE